MHRCISSEFLIGEMATQNSTKEAQSNGGFELPEFDELTHRRLLPKSALHDGAYYVGRCRNASVARWNARQQCFYHWREKFGRIYIEKIKHPVDEPHSTCSARWRNWLTPNSRSHSTVGRNSVGCQRPLLNSTRGFGAPARAARSKKSCVVHFGGPKAGSDAERRC